MGTKIYLFLKNVGKWIHLLSLSFFWKKPLHWRKRKHPKPQQAARQGKSTEATGTQSKLQTQKWRNTPISPITTTKTTSMFHPQEDQSDYIIQNAGSRSHTLIEQPIISSFPKTPKIPIDDHGKNPSFLSATAPLIHKLQELHDGREPGQVYPCPQANPILYLNSHSTIKHNVISRFLFTAQIAIRGIDRNTPRQ